ncbi:YbjN domain-containing protein [Phenylobacterium sp.]|uniref:YbjN domain-containing protein n=1 Tax=Phenylobacterium sp. TaxID=1871053 RepID=UPI002DEA9982|nr:YbjN domain-containing protein [Phenylobacterium sp.]
MELRTLVAAAVMACSVLAAGPAVSRNLPAGGVTRQEVAAWLEAGGHPATIHADSAGEIIVSSSNGGVNWDIYFYKCAAGRCADIQYAAGWTEITGMTLDKVNQWNHDKRLIRAYLGPKSSVWGEYDVVLSPGGSWEQLDTSLRDWSSAVLRFKTFILG